MDERRRLTPRQLHALMRSAHLTDSSRATTPRTLPGGALTELYGTELSGKTTAALRFIAHLQAGGDMAALIDADEHFDRRYAEQLGVNCAALTLVQTASGAAALAMAEELLRSGALGLLAIDSVGGLFADDDGEQVRHVVRACVRLAAIAAATNSSVLITHRMVQLTTGELGGHPAGQVLRFYAALRLDVRHVLTNGWTLA